VNPRNPNTAGKPKKIKAIFLILAYIDNYTLMFYDCLTLRTAADAVGE
jgi:hypothetical protein